MIIDGGWFDFAERMPGPASKLWPEQNMRLGVVFHSAVGTLQGVIDVVMGPSSNRRSVTGVIGYDGRFIQFYPVTQSPWANGEHQPNIRFLGFEHEGGEDEPSKVHERLTEEQIAVDVRILQDLAEFDQYPVTIFKRPVSKTDKTASLYEHNEMVRWGAAPTACPSGRIPWDEIMQRLDEGNPMPQENYPDELNERRAIDGLLKNILDGDVKVSFIEGKEYTGYVLVDKDMQMPVELITTIPEGATPT